MFNAFVACFNVHTGDIEDSPGLDSLWSFSATVRDGKVVVKASEKEVNSKIGRIVGKARTGKNPIEDTVVIVGGGSGGIHTTESLRMVSTSCNVRWKLTTAERLPREYCHDLRGKLRTDGSVSTEAGLKMYLRDC